MWLEELLRTPGEIRTWSSITIPLTGFSFMIYTSRCMDDPELQTRDMRPAPLDGNFRFRLSRARLSQLAALAAVVIAAACTIAGAGVEARNVDSGRSGVSSPPAPNGTTDAFENIRAIRDSGVPIRILPLGDSITEGYPVPRSYRYVLWIKMIETGIDFDFVGSLSSSTGFNPDHPPESSRTFDHDHEGHSSWSIDHILHGHPKGEGQKLSEWLKAYTPDIALVHLGTNDMIASESTSSAADKLRQVIEALRSDNPNVIVLLAKLIPVTPPDINRRIDELNERIGSIAKEMSSAASPVIVVDLNSEFDAKADMYDGLHPNESGERKMADKWFEALKSVFGI